MNSAGPSQIERMNALRLTSEDSRIQLIAEDLRKAITEDDVVRRADCDARLVALHIGRLEIYLHGITVIAKLEYLRSGDDDLAGRYEFFMVREDVLGTKTAESLGFLEFNGEGKLRFGQSGQWVAQIVNQAPYADKLRSLMLGHVAFWVQQRMPRLV